MPLPSDFLNSWEYLPPPEVFEMIQQAPKPLDSAHWIIHNEIRPADLFCYLGARFGPPNGVQNFLRDDDSDNLIHWDWTFRTSTGHVMILGMNFRTEVLLGSDAEVGLDDREKFIQRLKADFGNYGKGMSELRKFLEPWVEFVNPYQRLRHSITQLLEQLNALGLDPANEQIADPFADMSPVEAKGRWQDIARRYSQGVGLCFGIRSMLPVMAEAFVNMLLYVLMRPEIRNDARLRDNAFRQPIDVRVKSLSINCIGFARQVDYSTPACARYHSLVNERNDLLHGNVVIDKLKFNEVYFWGKVPVFKEYRSMWQRSIGVSIQAAGLEGVSDELATVDQFTEYLLTCLEDEVRPLVERVLNRRDLGFNTKTGRVGVLFPGWLVDMKPAFRSAEGTSTAGEAGPDSTTNEGPTPSDL